MTSACILSWTPRTQTGASKEVSVVVSESSHGLRFAALLEGVAGGVSLLGLPRLSRNPFYPAYSD